MFWLSKTSLRQQNKALRADWNGSNGLYHAEWDANEESSIKTEGRE